MHTRPLLSLAEGFWTRQLHKDTQLYEEDVKYIDQCLTLAYDRHRNAHLTRLVSTEIVISNGALARFLTWLRCESLSKVHWNEHIWFLPFAAPQNAFKITTDSGWCPSQIASVGSLPLAIQYFAANLQFDGPAGFHEACTSRHCVAFKTVLRTQHVTEDCHCEPFSADQTHLQDILEAGGLPLIQLAVTVEKISLSPESFEIKDGALNHRYVAISHVWSVSNSVDLNKISETVS